MKTGYWGKIIGGCCGFLSAGPIGAGLGIWIGHWFDKGLLRNRFVHHAEAQKIFFDTTFLVMGHIAKADGHVSQNEIHVAETIMDKLQLSPEQRKLAMSLFISGKQPHFDLNTTLETFHKACPFHSGLVQMFIEIQLQAAYADGVVQPNVQRILQNIAQHLGMRTINFDFFDTLFGHYQSHTQYSQYTHSSYTGDRPSYSLQKAYTLLGIDQKATDAEFKKAYRRKMNEYHPDKLIAKGLPEEMIKVATEKTQQIKSAYEQIRQSRNL